MTIAPSHPANALDSRHTPSEMPGAFHVDGVRLDDLLRQLDESAPQQDEHSSNTFESRAENTASGYSLHRRSIHSAYVTVDVEWHGYIKQVTDDLVVIHAQMLPGNRWERLELDRARLSPRQDAFAAEGNLVDIHIGRRNDGHGDRQYWAIELREAISSEAPKIARPTVRLDATE